jgi:ribosomal protein L32
MVIRMRHTRAHTGNRRSHHALKNPPITVDAKSGVTHRRHRLGVGSATWNGRIVTSVEKKIARQARRASEKAEGKR